MNSIEHIKKIANIGTRKSEIVIGEIDKKIIESLDIEDFSNKEQLTLSLLSTLSLYKKTNYITKQITYNEKENESENINCNLISSNLSNIFYIIAKKNYYSFELESLIFEFFNKLKKSKKEVNPLIKLFLTKNPKFLQEKEVNESFILSKNLYLESINFIDKYKDIENYISFLNKLDFIEIKRYLNNFYLEININLLNKEFPELNDEKLYKSNSDIEELIYYLLLNNISKFKLSDISKMFNIKEEELIEDSMKYSSIHSIILDDIYTKKRKILYYLLIDLIHREEYIDKIVSIIKNNPTISINNTLNYLPQNISECLIKDFIEFKGEKLNLYDIKSILQKYNRNISLDLSIYIIELMIKILEKDNYSYYSYDFRNDIQKICIRLDFNAQKNVKIAIKKEHPKVVKYGLKFLKKILYLTSEMSKEFDK